MNTRKIPFLAPFLLALTGPAFAAPLPQADPASLGFDPARLALVSKAVHEAIDNHVVSGAVVLVGRSGKIALVEAVGNRQVKPAPEPMARDTIFDMASLTKPVATASSVMLLIERGQLRLDQRLGDLLPEFDNHGKGAITLEQLLRHRSGLIADNPVSDYEDGPETAWKNLANLDLSGTPGEKFLYSDVNFIILGRIVERVSGKPLKEFALEEIFKPLGMTSTRFGRSPDDDPSTWPLDRTAPTAFEDGQWLTGLVHDPRARLLGGYAGHAGLFSTADDLALYAQMILNEGEGTNGRCILAPLTVRLMTDPGDTPEGQRRGLGWDISTGFSSPRGALFGPRSFGHTGFTGTSIWIDPDTQTFVILLTSRLHPDDHNRSPIALRRQIATLTAAAITSLGNEPKTSDSPVTCGIDVLISRKFDILQGKRVGLITNHSGLSRDGRSTIDVLHDAPGVKLTTLFSPEHGIRGNVDRKVGDSKDEKTGLPIFSLYGKTRKPTPEMLKNVDILVYDIQDIGARFYTYSSTLGLSLEAAKEQDIPLVVLDRPNPIGGSKIGGPVRDDEFSSFIAYHAVPVRHGLTIGEMARLFNDERNIHADLTVIPCEGWRRGDLYDRTGLLWVNPSPNMRSLNEALLYPGVGLLEFTNLATGRGTDTPFERLGAPYIDPLAFSESLNQSNLPGLRFVPIRFSPSERQFKDEDCGGVFVLITDRSRVDPIRLGIQLAVSLRTLYPDTWKPSGLRKMIADEATYQAIVDGKSTDEIMSVWKDELDKYRQRREKYLLYPE